MHARNQKIFVQHQKGNRLRLHKNLGLNVPNKKHPKVCAAAYEVLPVIDDLIHVFKHEFAWKII